MAVIRRNNWRSQMRLDIPHLRMIESGVVGDFDALAGRIMAGQEGYVVKGFTINNSFVGSAATSCVMAVAGGSIIHPNASENGSIFFVPDDTEDEILSSSNAKVIGSFTANAKNYIGLDLKRITDSDSNDLIKFLDPTTGSETSKVIPTAIILDYRILVTTNDFSSSENILPIAILTLNSSSVITAIEDARPMYFRLASGGTTPDSLSSYDWASRIEPNANVFTGSDKDIDSQKAWQDAIMTRLWELGGGENWFSPTADKNVKVAYGSSIITASGDNFYFDGTNLQWKDIEILFDNSTATYNTVQDELTGVAFPDGSCLYVDLQRDTEGATIIPAVVALADITGPLLPGSRLILAWRKGTDVFAKEKPANIGREYPLATNSTYGIVKLYKASDPVSEPTVLNEETLHNPDAVTLNASPVATVDANGHIVQEGAYRDFFAQRTIKVGQNLTPDDTGTGYDGMGHYLGLDTNYWLHGYISYVHSDFYKQTINGSQWFTVEDGDDSDRIMLKITRADGGKVGVNLIPITTATYDLGSATYRWNTGYFSNLNSSDEIICAGYTETATLGVTGGVSATLPPLDNESYDLGTSLLRWNNAHIKTVTTDNIDFIGTMFKQLRSPILVEGYNGNAPVVDLSTNETYLIFDVASGGDVYSFVTPPFPEGAPIANIGICGRLTNAGTLAATDFFKIDVYGIDLGDFPLTKTLLSTITYGGTITTNTMLYDAAITKAVTDCTHSVDNKFSVIAPSATIVIGDAGGSYDKLAIEITVTSNPGSEIKLYLSQIYFSYVPTSIREV